MNTASASSSSASSSSAATVAAATTAATTALSRVQESESVADFINAERVRRAAQGDEEILIEWLGDGADECAPIDDDEEDEFDGASMQVHDGSVDGADDAPFRHTRSKDFLPRWA